VCAQPGSRVIEVERAELLGLLLYEDVEVAVEDEPVVIEEPDDEVVVGMGEEPGDIEEPDTEVVSAMGEEEPSDVEVLEVGADKD